MATAANTHHPQRRPISVVYDIGPPMTFTSGNFAGHTIRTELEEIQNADRGRKYARKDKRPLDPPPVVTCRCFEVIPLPSSTGGVLERELDPEQATLGVLCHVDLFPVPDECVEEPGVLYPPGRGAQGAPLPLLPEVSCSRPPVPTPSVPIPPAYTPRGYYIQRASSPPRQPAVPTAPVPSVPIPSTHVLSEERVDPTLTPIAQPFLVSEPADDIVGWFRNYPIRENTSYTFALAGSTFVHGAIVELEGRKTATFIFTDLAVKVEGVFVLRYRAFTIYSQRAIDPGLPVLAECYGGPFKIYGTKSFPGLRPSTALTKTLALQGVRVHLRERERKGRKTPRRSSREARASGHRSSSGSDGESDGPPHRMGTRGRQESRSPPTTLSPTSPAASVRSSFGGSEAHGPTAAWAGPQPPGSGHSLEGGGRS